MTDRRRIIVVEDDSDFCEIMVEYLTLSGLEVTGVESALEFYQSISLQHDDVVIPDIGLPDQNGIVLAEYVRNNTDMRIIMLTVQSSLESKINAHHAGADIYLVKPVDFSELSASIFSIPGRLNDRLTLQQKHTSGLQAMHQKLTPWVRHNDWTLCTPSGDEIKLTSKEYDLLQRLALSPDTTVKRHDLLRALDYEVDEHGSRSLDALIHRLRRKTRKLNYGVPIKTSHSLGYCFSAQFIVE